jgi:acetyl-CoA C-acetyltransferase
MGRRAAVVGAGMTRFVRRARETGKELSWEAARAALDSAGLALGDVDAVCCVTAPDAFDGVHRKGEYLADGGGAVGRPFIRTYVGGGSGVFGGIQGWYTVASGDADVVLVVAEEKMSSCQPHPQGAFLTIFDNILERALGPNLLWIFALEMQRYMAVHGLDKRDIATVAVKNKRNAADHPAALLGTRDLTVDDVLASEVLAWPVQRLDVSPISDGAVALVIASEDVAARVTDRPVWIQGVGWNLDTAYWTNRDLVYPEYVEHAARMAYEMAGVKEPRKEIHVVEPYDPFDYKELHHLEGLLLFDRGKAPEAARDGVLDRDGDLPSCPSGGLLGVGNPIAAAGLMKLAELFWQLRGEAGARQVPGTPERGLAQAWGDLMQVGTVVVMGTDGPPRTAAREAPPAEVPDAGDAARATPPRDPVGTSLSEAEFRGEVGAVEDALDARYAWDAGRAIGGFLAGLREGRLLGRECSGCGRVLVPPRMFCERCFRPTDRWIDVPPTGTVQTYSICHVSWDMRPLERPQLPAVIRFDGTEDGGLLHLLGDVEPQDVHVGMRVEAVWRAPEDRTGSILDVAHFRPNPEPSDTVPTPVPEPGAEPRTWPGEMPVRHRYTPGMGGVAFAGALRERGALVGSRCDRCGTTYAPARAFCERCFGPVEPGVEVGPAGTLVSWTVAHRGTEGEPLEAPRTYGLVRLDGADTVLLHELIDVADPRAGMAVRAVVRPAAERTGTIRDVVGFGPG